MFKYLAAAALAVGLAAPAQAATLQSSTAFFEVETPNPVIQQTVLTVFNSLGSRLNFAEFDPIFGTLTGVTVILDATVSTNFNAQTPFGGVTVRNQVSLGWDFGLALSSDRASYASGANVWHTFSTFDRSFARLEVPSVQIDAFVGTGQKSLGFFGDQFLTSSGILGFTSIDQPIAEFAMAASVEYTFTPGVQTIETQEALLRFSSAFVPEIVADRNDVDLTPVPLPATAPMLLAGILAAGWVARRRKG